MADSGPKEVDVLWIGSPGETGVSLPDKYRVTYVPQAADHERKTEELRPDVVLLDLIEGEGEQFKTLLNIHRILLTVPVLGLVDSGSEILKKAIEAGLHDFLSIPFTPEELESRINLASRRLDVAQTYNHAAGFIAKCSIDLEVPTDFKLVAPLADILTRDLRSAGLTTGEVVFHLRLTLSELLTNAMEHGSLGISLEEKMAALEGGGFDLLLSQRMADDKLMSRRVRVKAVRTREKVSFTIQDQGDGFDVEEIMARLADPNPLMPCGRGLYLLQQFVDDFRFEDGGRRVILEKRLSPDRED